MIRMSVLSLLLVAGSANAGDLTGNWVVRAPQEDGTTRRTYLNLKQEGPRITGSIRLTQFFYTIKESTSGPDGFVLTGHDARWKERAPRRLRRKTGGRRAQAFHAAASH